MHLQYENCSMDMDGGDVVITQRGTDIIKVINKNHTTSCIVIK